VTVAPHVARSTYTLDRQFACAPRRNKSGFACVEFEFEFDFDAAVLDVVVVVVVIIVVVVVVDDSGVVVVDETLSTSDDDDDAASAAAAVAAVAAADAPVVSDVSRSFTAACAKQSSSATSDCECVNMLSNAVSESSRTTMRAACRAAALSSERTRSSK
jgi:hypothetical protein